MYSPNASQCLDNVQMENKTTKTKDSAIFIRISEDEKAELYGIAAKLDVPFSQIAREAIREKIASIKAAQAETAGASA